MDIIDKTTCLDRYLGSFEDSLASRNYKSETLKNYRHLLRRFGKLLGTEGIEPSALTPDLAVELGRRLPTTPKSQIKIPNLVRLFVANLIEIGVATRPPLTPARAERAELLSNFETYLLRQRGLSLRSVYHVLRFADRFLDHRFGDHMLDLPALNARDVVAFMEHLLSRKRKSYARERDRLLGRRPEAFFVTCEGHRLGDCGARYNFAHVCQQIGLREAQLYLRHGRGPRIHDLRHNSGMRIIPATAAQGLHFLENRRS